MVQDGLYLASMSFPPVAFTATINHLASDKANSLLASNPHYPVQLGTSPDFTLQLVFWASILAIAIAESILVTVTLRHIRSQTKNRVGLGASSIIEFLWTMAPPLFTVILAVLSVNHLRPMITIDLAETALLGCGALLLVTSMGILLARYLQATRMKRSDEAAMQIIVPDRIVPINYEQPEEAIYPARAASLSIESEALPRGNL